MPFCITEQEYLEDPELYTIVSGPFLDTCQGCSTIGLGGSLSEVGSFFEVSVPLMPVTFMSEPNLWNMSESNLIFINIRDFSTHSFAANTISKQNEGIYLKGRVFSGSAPYNSPWNFVLDTESFVMVSEVDASRLDLSPSTIEQMLSSGALEQGGYVYFLFSGRARQIEKIGVMYCDKPLEMSVRKTSDASGQLFIEGYCEGNCVETLNDGMTVNCPQYELDMLNAQMEEDFRKIDEEIDAKPQTTIDIMKSIYLEGLSEEDRTDYLNSEAEYEENLDALSNIDEDYEEVSLE